MKGVLALSVVDASADDVSYCPQNLVVAPMVPTMSQSI